MYKQVFTNLLIVAMAAAWLIPFIEILRYGTHLVHEPNPVILITEIAGFCFIVAFGISNLIRLARSRK